MADRCEHYFLGFNSEKEQKMRKVLLMAGTAICLATQAFAMDPDTSAQRMLSNDFAVCSAFYAFMAGLASDDQTLSDDYMDWSNTWRGLATETLGQEKVNETLELMAGVAHNLKTEQDLELFINEHGPYCLKLTDAKKVGEIFKGYRDMIMKRLQKEKSA
jgi:hypothetical protein